jgi:hypothetical protein
MSRCPALPRGSQRFAATHLDDDSNVAWAGTPTFGPRSSGAQRASTLVVHVELTRYGATEAYDVPIFRASM